LNNNCYNRRLYIKNMKSLRIILSLVTVFFLTASFKPANELKWLGFNDGYALAKKKGKIMLVDVYTDWCGWCKRMDRDTYEKPEIIEALNKDFVVIKFNPEIQNVMYTFEGKEYNGQQLAAVISNNQISGYPTTIFMSPKYKKMNVIAGYYDPARFKPVLESIVTEFSKKSK